jgi:hypothetical protein
VAIVRAGPAEIVIVSELAQCGPDVVLESGTTRSIRALSGWRTPPSSILNVTPGDGYASPARRHVGRLGRPCVPYDPLACGGH